MKEKVSLESDLKLPGGRSRSLLNRGNLRNLVILLACISALFQPIGSAKIFISFFLLTLGSFIHFVTKGILIRSELTQCGIYRLVRHPYYMASYLIDLSFCLLSNNSYLLIVYPFLFFWTYGYTMRKEDTLLLKMHRDSFLQYIADVPSFFPDALSPRDWKQLFEGFSIKRISKKEVARLLRYWATALLILFLHGINARGLKHLGYLFNHDYWQVQIVALLLVILYLANLIILWSSRKPVSRS